MNVSLAVVLAFVLAALVISVTVFLLSDGVGNLEKFMRTNIDISLGFI